MRLTLVLLFFTNILFAQLNTQLVANFTYNEKLSDVWGYLAPNGTEYALVATKSGTSIVSLAVPSAPTEVAFVPSPSSTWRDIKTWQHYAYVINQNDGGLQIINLENLPNSVTYEHWLPIIGNDRLKSAHNIFIDEFGIAYITASNVNQSILMFDLAANPEAPTFIGQHTGNYVHDIYVRDNMAYSANIYSGMFQVIDLSDKDVPQVLASHATPFEFTHNTWLSDDGQTLFTTDERTSASIAAYDVSDVDNIRLLDEILPLKSLGQGTIPHNVHVQDDFLVTSFNTDGVTIVDAARPHNLIEVGNYDTFLENEYGFFGCWGAYPFLPSKLILATDRTNGLFVLEPTYKRACYLEGKVSNANTNAVLNGVQVKINSNLAVSTLSNFAGDYATGLAEAATYDVRFEKEGFYPKTLEVGLQNGILTELDVQLEPLVSSNATVENEIAFHLSPNPCTDVLHIQTAHMGNTTLEIYNILGQKVVQHPLTNSPIYIGNKLAEGTYFARIRLQNSVSKAIKFIVHHS